MASANKLSYLYKVVYDALNADPTFSVQKVVNKSYQPNGTRILVFPNLIAVNQTAMMESGELSSGTATIRIWSDVAVPAEGATPTGKSFQAYTDAIARIEAAIGSIAIPQQETHTDGTSTAIVGIGVGLIGGHVDNGDTKIEADCDVTIQYRYW